jgi:hypothetical protein
MSGPGEVLLGVQQLAKVDCGVWIAEELWRRHPE